MSRLETGLVQMPDDWTGVFIRGDNALMGYAPSLRRVLALAKAAPNNSGVMDAIALKIVEDFARLLETADVRGAPGGETAVQQIDWRDDAS